jgi:hypothetical protein
MIEWILYDRIRVGLIKGTQLPHLKEWSWSSSEGHMQLNFFVSDPVIQCLCCAPFVTSCQNINPSLMWRIATIMRVFWERYKLFDTKLWTNWIRMVSNNLDVCHHTLTVGGKWECLSYSCISWCLFLCVCWQAWVFEKTIVTNVLWKWGRGGYFGSLLKVCVQGFDRAWVSSLCSTPWKEILHVRSPILYTVWNDYPYWKSSSPAVSFWGCLRPPKIGPFTLFLQF